MNFLKKLTMGFLIVSMMLGVTALVQTYKNVPARAANTLTGSNEVITISDTTDGQPINSTVSPIGYSSDGNIILFASSGTNLPNAGGSTAGLYVHNIATSTTIRADISTSGTLPNGNYMSVAGGLGAQLSETGRYITFMSSATNLIDGTTKSPRMSYRHDVQTGETIFVGGGYSGGDTEKFDRNLAVSNDGRFSLISSRYIANTYPYNYGLVLGDNISGTYTWTSLGKGSYDSGYADMTTGQMSCDGAFAVFKKQYDIILADLRNGSKTELIAGNAMSISPMISCNGRYVVYATKNRTDITPTPSGMNAYLHLVRYDRITKDRIYVDSNSSNVFSTAQLQDNPTHYDQMPNTFNASIADSGDMVFDYKQGANTYAYLKHLSDGSGTLEPLARTSSGSYINVSKGAITNNGRYVFFKADPFDLGIGSSPAGVQIIRAKTNL